MKKLKAAALIGLTAGACFGLYEILKNDKVRAKTTAVVNTAGNIATDVGFATAEGIRSAVKKECTVGDAICNTFALVKDMVKDDILDCKNDLDFIDAVEDLDDAKTEAADMYASIVINKNTVDKPVDDLEKDTDVPEIDVSDEIDDIELDESDDVDDIDDIEIDVEESEIFEDIKAEDAEQDVVAEQADAEVDVPAITEEQFVDKVENENGDDVAMVVINPDNADVEATESEIDTADNLAE